MANPEENYSLFSMLNLCRLFFYTPIVFFGGVLGSIAYDYITYKELESAKESELESSKESELESESDKEPVIDSEPNKESESELELELESDKVKEGKDKSD